MDDRAEKLFGPVDSQPPTKLSDETMARIAEFLARCPHLMPQSGPQDYATVNMLALRLGMELPADLLGPVLKGGAATQVYEIWAAIDAIRAAQGLDPFKIGDGFWAAPGIRRWAELNDPSRRGHWPGPPPPQGL
jgi:hypothetical protein